MRKFRPLKNTIALIVALSCFAACMGKHKYSVFIAQQTSNGVSEDIVEQFEAKDDTSAFIEATKTYWSKKAATLETNKKLEADMAVPYSFILFKINSPEDSAVITFSKLEAERLTTAVLKHYKETVMPRIDTMTSVMGRGRNENPDIF